MASVSARENSRAARANRPTDPAPCLHDAFKGVLRRDILCARPAILGFDLGECVSGVAHKMSRRSLTKLAPLIPNPLSESRNSEAARDFSRAIILCICIEKSFLPETQLPDFGYFFWRIFALFFPPQMGVETVQY